MNHEVTWFSQANGGFSALVNGKSICYEPTIETLKDYADSLTYEQAVVLLIEIYNETVCDEDEYLYDDE